MATDALAPKVARPSATMVLSMKDKWVLIFDDEGSELTIPVTSHDWEMITKIKLLYLSFLN